MQDLQGTSIPKMIGLYYGDKKDGSLICCLVLERFGEALSCTFDELARWEKYAFFVIPTFVPYEA
jgi:hypothetical protein